MDKPEYLLGQARILVEELRASSANLHEEQARIEKELESLMTERQWVITQARKGAFTTADMEQQLGTLTMQEISLKRELSTLGQAININALNDWEAKFSEHLADLRAGIDELRNAAPQNEEERHAIFLLKKQMVDVRVHNIVYIFISKKAHDIVNRFVELSLCAQQNPLKIRLKTSFFECLRASVHDVLDHPRDKIHVEKCSRCLGPLQVDTLVERATINKNREVKIEIRVNLQSILERDAGLGKPNPGAYSRRGETYTRIHDMYPAGEIQLRL